MNLDAEYGEYRDYIEEFAKTIDPVSTRTKLLYPKIISTILLSVYCSMINCLCESPAIVFGIMRYMEKLSNGC